MKECRLLGHRLPLCTMTALVIFGLMTLGLQLSSAQFYHSRAGASRAPGLPQAATWRICGRTRTHSGRGQMTQGSPCVPLSGRGWGPVAPAAQFRRCCAACGQKVKTRRAGTVQRPLGQYQLQRKSASRKSVFGSLGAFNFSTRIKGRRRFTDIGPVTQSRRAGRWSWTI